MNKPEFMKRLQIELSASVSREESDKAMLYYGELIDEAVDNDNAECDVIAKLPPPAEIAKNLSDILYKEKSDKVSDADIQFVIDKIFEDDKEEGKASAKEKTYQRESYQEAYRAPQQECSEPGNEESCRDPYTEPRQEPPRETLSEGGYVPLPPPQKFSAKMKENFRNIKEDIRDEGHKLSENVKSKGRKIKDDFRSDGDKNVLGKAIIFLFLLVFVIPALFCVLAVVWVVMFGCLVSAFAIMVCGFCSPFVSIAAAVYGESAMIFFTGTAAGMLLLAIGAFGAKISMYLTKAALYITKKLFAGMGALLK
jgi:uncharacterized membrane protein